jgi:hypothetical protein
VNDDDGAGPAREPARLSATVRWAASLPARGPERDREPTCGQGLPPLPADLLSADGYLC